MQRVTRQSIFAQAAKKLRHDFDELSSIPHSGLKGHEAEDIVRQFLRGHLPKRFDVGSGFVIDPLDNISRQTDVIIYDALNCPVYRASETAAIIPSDNVACVIEVKSRLDKDAMRDAFANISELKALAKTKPPSVPFLVTTQTLCCLFAFSTPITMEKLSEHYVEYAKSHGIGRHIDIVLVLDKGIIMLAGKLGEHPWAPLILEGFGGKAGEGAHIAATLMKSGEDSLDIFLRFLLGQLIHFRGMVGHPGFQWVKDGAPGNMFLTYITSVTSEKDPTLREQRLRALAEEVRTEFERSPLPTDSDPAKGKRADSKIETPSVIILPDQSSRHQDD
jgi:hypothetical protein